MRLNEVWAIYLIIIVCVICITLLLLAAHPIEIKYTFDITNNTLEAVKVINWSAIHK